MTRSIQFTLVVDDFGVKYVGKEHADHLIQAIKSDGYEMKTDWTGSLYCGITHDWGYDTRTLDMLMPGYIEKLPLKFKHGDPSAYRAAHTGHRQKSMEKEHRIQYQMIQERKLTKIEWM